MSPSAEPWPVGPFGPEFSELGEIAQAVEQPEIRAEIATTARTLARRELTVAVLGQFKRGKSTLLNAFAGRDVFPSGLLPLTAVATHLVRGPEGVRVTEADGTVRPVPLSDVPQFVSERENPGNRRRVARVEISIPLPDWTEGVTFIDCPGIGSPHEANTAAARAVLPRADLAVFVLSPDPPITAEEIQFLSEVSSHASRFFFVLNKVDLVPERERGEVEVYLEQILRVRCGFDAVRLYPVSARQAVEGGGARDPTAWERSGLLRLWEALRQEVGAGRDQSLRGVAGTRVRQYTQRLRGLIDLARRTSELSQDEFGQRLAALEAGVADVRVEHRATQAMLREEVATLARRMEERPHELLDPHAASVQLVLEASLDRTAKVSAGGLVRALDRELREQIPPVVREARRVLESEVTAELDRIGKEFEARLRRWGEALRTVVAREFDVALPPLEVEVPLAEPLHYHDRVEGLFEGTLAGQTVLFLPAGVLRRRLRSQLPRIVTEELDAQSGRLRADLTDRVHRSWQSLERRLQDQLNRQIETVEHALAEGRRHQRDDGARSERWRAQLDELLRRLDILRARAG